MKKSIIVLVMFLPFWSIAQMSEVNKKLDELNIPRDVFEQGLKDEDAAYSFDAKITTTTSEKTDVQEAKFDATQPVGKKWTLVSNNGETPTKKEINLFDKAHNTKKRDINAKIDDRDFVIEKEDDKELIIGFSFREESLPKKYQFLAGCKGMAFIDKEKGLLNRVEFNSTEPVKIKIFKVTKFELAANYVLDKENNHYLTGSEDLYMQIKLFGQLMDVDEKTEYSNYQKVK